MKEQEMRGFWKLWMVSLLFCGALWGVEDTIAAQSVSKSLLIVKSTTNYGEAESFAQELAKKSGLKLDLRGLEYNEKIMLSERADVCKESGFKYPCYVARGRYDDGVYLSVESSDAYVGFTKGYYIVVAASMERRDKEILQKLKRYVPDAYVKRTSIYMGCIH